LPDYQVLKEKEMPHSGIHIDLSVRELHVWTADPQPDFVRRLQSTWSGWRVNWQHDRYEFQETITGGRVRFPSFNDQELLARLAPIILRDLDRENPVARFESMTESLRSAGHDVKVATPATSWHVDWLPSREERERIWTKTLRSLRLT
jgi:hypothetical protein